MIIFAHMIHEWVYLSKGNVDLVHERHNTASAASPGTPNLITYTFPDALSISLIYSYSRMGVLVALFLCPVALTPVCASIVPGRKPG